MSLRAAVAVAVETIKLDGEHKNSRAAWKKKVKEKVEFIDVKISEEIIIQLWVCFSVRGL